MKKKDVALALVFITVFMQMSLGGFCALFIADILSIFGFEGSSWLMAGLVFIPVLLVVLISIPYFKSSYEFLSIQKNLQDSWLFKELLALSFFIVFLAAVVLVYFFQLHIVLRITLEAFTLALGIFGIYAQSMAYRAQHHPAWNKETTNIKFFCVAYIGVFLVVVFAVLFNLDEIVYIFISLGIFGAFAQLFFSLEDIRMLVVPREMRQQLIGTAKLYNRVYKKLKTFRFITLSVGGIALPFLLMALIEIQYNASATFVAICSLVLVFASELTDRYLFYATVVSAEEN